MKIKFSARAWEDYQYWIRTDKKTLRHLNTLIADIARQPYQGIGKPEPLRHELSGFWSRRITSEHRIVYRLEDDETILIIQCRFHY